MKKIEEKLGYSFKNPELLEHALIHSSYANEQQAGKGGSNERLEFLGDAVLELITSEFFYAVYPDKSEGELTKIRASFVCEAALVKCATKICLKDFIKLGKGEERTGGRERPSIISDTFEALIGAIYLDGGFASAKEIVEKFILKEHEDRVFFFDSKTILQEEVRMRGMAEPAYSLLAEEGPEHHKEFIVAVHIGGEEYGRASGSSKKNAQQKAAYEALKKLGK